MDQDQIDELLREQGGPYVFDRMFSAVEKVRERLDRACQALNSADVPYAVIGGNAVAAWVATRDCLLYTSPSPRDATLSRMPSSA